MHNLIALGNGYTQTKFHDHTHTLLPYENVKVDPGAPLHCIPRIESILLHQDALRSYSQDTMLVNRNRKLQEKDDEMYLMKHNYELAVQQENQKYLDQSKLNANLQTDLGLANKQIKKEKSGKTFWKVMAGLFAGAAGVLAISR